MRVLTMALVLALWQGDAARASGQAASLARRQLVKRLDSFLLKQALAGMNVGGSRVILGIDLGTTNSAAAILDGNVPRIIPNHEGDNITPSVVDFSEGGGVGEAALKALEFFPAHVINSIKRLMGLTYAEAKEKGLVDNLAYTVVSGDKGMAEIEIEGKRYKPQVVAARILKKLKDDAERSLGREITEAVVTVPARFDDRQKKATAEAVAIAGLDLVRLVAEPTAAFLAHVGQVEGGEMKVLVYDLGGGTFDVSILDFAQLDENNSMSEVVTTEGNPLLGGDDFDNRIVNYLLERIKTKDGVDLSGDREALAELKTEAIDAKEALSGSESATIRLRKLGAQSLTVSETLTRARFEGLISDLVAQTIAMTEKALGNDNLTVDDIDRVLMVGGSTRVAAVSKAVEDLFGAEKVSRADNPDEVVALGAAVQAAVVGGNVSGVTLIDRTSLDLGIEVKGGLFAEIIPKDEAIPTTKSETFTTDSDNQSAVTISIYEGEAKTPAGKPNLVQYSHRIGEFTLDGIPPAPRGVPQIKVEFSVDASKMVKVTAHNTGTNKKKDLEIAIDAMSDENIKEMQAMMEANAGDIEAKSNLAEAKNRLDGLLVQAETLLRINGDELSTESKTSLGVAIEAAKKNLNSDDIEAVENSIKGFQTEIYAVNTELYGEADPGS